MTPLTMQQKDEIRDYVAAAESDADRERRCQECKEKYGINTRVFGAIIAHIKIRAKKALERHPDMQSHEIKAIDLPDAPQKRSQRKRRKTEAATGEFADYDNEMKRQWRLQWRSYLEECIPPEKRAAMRVLCLPGRKCLEIPLYLDLGFTPRNIIGVEGGDKAARKEFRKNAERLGIRAYEGQLEDLLAEQPGEFDVVSLDFHGPYCVRNMEILQHIPIARRIHVMVNLLAQREGKAAQKVFQTIADSVTGRKQERTDKMMNGHDPLWWTLLHLMKGYGTRREREKMFASAIAMSEKFEKTCTDLTPPEPLPLEEARIQGMVPAVLLTVGQLYDARLRNRWPIDQWTLPEWLGDRDSAVIRLMQRYSHEFETWMRERYITEGSNLPLLGSFLRTHIHTFEQWESVKKVRYRSRSSDHHSPYFTCMATLTDASPRGTPSETAAFFQAVLQDRIQRLPAVDVPERIKDLTMFEELRERVQGALKDPVVYNVVERDQLSRPFFVRYLRPKLARTLRSKGPLCRSDVITARCNGKLLARLSASAMSDELDRYSNLVGGNERSSLDIAKAPWETIEVAEGNGESQGSMDSAGSPQVPALQKI